MEEAKVRASKTLLKDPELSGYPILQEKAKMLFERGLNL
jgi:hypothetical protein